MKKIKNYKIIILKYLSFVFNWVKKITLYFLSFFLSCLIIFSEFIGGFFFNYLFLKLYNYSLILFKKSNYAFYLFYILIFLNILTTLCYFKGQNSLYINRKIKKEVNANFLLLDAIEKKIYFQKKQFIDSHERDVIDMHIRKNFIKKGKNEFVIFL